MVVYSDMPLFSEQKRKILYKDDFHKIAVCPMISGIKNERASKSLPSPNLSKIN